MIKNNVFLLSLQNKVLRESFTGLFSDSFSVFCQKKTIYRTSNFVTFDHIVTTTLSKGCRLLPSINVEYI
jgi:hypothetical protein